MKKTISGATELFRKFVRIYMLYEKHLESSSSNLKLDMIDFLNSIVQYAMDHKFDTLPSQYISTKNVSDKMTAM